MIPQHVFFYWGNDTMSWLRFLTLATFRKLNPDWKVSLYYNIQPVKEKTWKEHNMQDFFCYHGENYLARIEDLGIDIVEWKEPDESLKNISASHKSNFFKWHMLATEGGVYADLDILWTRPMDQFFDILNNGRYDAALCYGGGQDGGTKEVRLKRRRVGRNAPAELIPDRGGRWSWTSIGLLASAGDNDFFRKLFDTALETYDPEHYQCVGVNSLYTALYGKGYSKNIFQRNIMRDIEDQFFEYKFFNIPMGLIYHYDYNCLKNVFEKDRGMETFPPDSIGIHWYAGNPLAQKYNSILTEDNYKDHPITICNVARKVLERK